MQSADCQPFTDEGVHLAVHPFKHKSLSDNLLRYTLFGSSGGLGLGLSLKFGLQ